MESIGADALCRRTIRQHAKEESMRQWRIVAAGLFATLTGVTIFIPLGQSADTSQERLVRYLLQTVHAFRTIYIENVLEHLKSAGIQPKENWNKDDHALMLPFQFVKLAGATIKDFEIGLISLNPIYTSNFPKTEREVHELKKLMSDPTPTILTFVDGGQYKGLMGDFAIEQSCVDCHNHHPNSHRRDLKKGDLMGAIVVRLKN
jgi:hypothetical protein